MSGEGGVPSVSSVPERRIHPSRPTTVGRRSQENRPEAVATPMLTRGEILTAASNNFHFGVVGEGRSQKILIFRSAGSLSQVTENEISMGGWTCEACYYENGSDSNRVCAMCGQHRHSSLMGMMHIDQDADAEEEEEAATIDKKSEVCRTKMPSLASYRCTNSRNLIVKRMSLSCIQETELTVDSLLQARDREKNEEKHELIASLARMSIDDAGGWTCPECTFANMDSNYLTCEVCGAKKPPKDNSLSSIQEFLTNSTKDYISDDSFIDPQIQAYLTFENIAAQKDMMTNVVMQNSVVLDAASQRPPAQLSDAEMSELRGILNEGQETLSALKAFYDRENKDFAAMDELQKMRAVEIESEEGMAPQQVLSERATRPGVQRVSGQVLEWHGQQRMLDDWRIQFDMRKIQIEQLETQQNQALDRILGH